MTSEPSIVAPALDLAVRIGCELVYDTTAEVPALVTMKPRYDALQAIRQESFHFEPQLTASEFEDDHLNIVYRLILKPGRNSLRYDAIVMVPSLREDSLWLDETIPPHLLPASVLRYTLPSRYCDSDKLLDFAWQKFGHLRQGLERILGICDWLHSNIEYPDPVGKPEPLGLRHYPAWLWSVSRSRPYGSGALPDLQSSGALRQRVCPRYCLPGSRHTV